MYLKSALSAFLLFNYMGGAVLAADSLDALQQDVVLAKQKHQQLVTKMDSVHDSLNADLRTRAAEDEIIARAESGRVLSSEPSSRVTTVLPAADAENPLVHLDPTPEKGETLFATARKKFERWFPGSGRHREPDKKDVHTKQPSPTPIADGEALFKVAISDGKITVDEAVEIGLANNVKLRAAKENIEVASAKIDEAKRGLFPTVQYVWERNGGKVPGGTGPRFYKGKNQKLNVSQPLYYGGELTNTIKQAQENMRVARAEYKKAKDDLVHQIRVAFYGVIKAEYNTQYQVELFEKIGVVLKKVRAQREAKVSPEVDALNVEAQHYQVLYQLEASKNDVLSANISLKQSMNLEMEGPVPVDLRIDFVKVQPTFQELMDRALENNADVRVKAFQVESARYGIDIYESKKKPHIDLRGSYGMLGEAFHDTEAFEDGKASIDPEKEWFLGVTGSMPLGPNTVEYEQIKHVYGPTVLALTGSEDWRHHVAFNLFDRMSAITDEKQAAYALVQAEAEYQDVVDQVTLKLRDEYYSLQRYLIQIDSSMAKMRYQQKQLGILEYLVSIQETTPSNYVENLIAQVQDRYAFIQAVADFNVALSGIGLLIGDPFYFENQREISPEKYEASEITGTQEE